MHSANPKTWAIANAIALVATIAVNVLANALPINGVTTGEVSDMYPTLFTPAGFTFVIWSVIYLALLVFVVYQAVDAWRRDGAVARITGPYFLLASVANCTWIVAWHHQVIWLTLPLMLVLLFALVQIYKSLEIGIVEVSLARKWYVHVPFQIYLAWITIATIANSAIFLVSRGWDGFGIDPRFWALFMLWVGITIAYRLLHTRKDLAFPLVVMWAFFGIAMERFAGEFTWAEPIGVGALAGIALLLLAVGYQLLFGTRKEISG